MKHPILKVLAGGAILSAALPVGAQYASESFNYPNGSQLFGSAAGQGDGGSGWGSKWSATAAAISTNSSPSLSYGSLVTSGGSVTVGNPTTSTFATTASSQRLLSGTFNTLAGGSGGTVWMSLIYQNLTTSTDGKAGFREAKVGFFSGATINGEVSNVNGSERLNVGSPNTYAAGATDTLSLFQGSTFVSSGIATPRGSDPADAVFILLRFDFDATAAADTAYAWFNPSLSLEPTIGTANAVFTTADLTSINAIRLQAGNMNANGPNAAFMVDELNLGPTWNSVVVVPEPSSWSFGALGLGFALWNRCRRRS